MADKNKALETALTQIEKKYGAGAIMRLGESKSLNVEAISTGSLLLDIATGIGGFPRGRIIEVYGPESSGKTTLALHAVAEAQKAGGEAAFVDAEHALDPLHARLMSQAMRKLTAVISKSNTVIIFINQLREKVGVVYGNPEVTTGGRALKFYSTMRVDVRRVESLKGTGGEFIGSRTKVKIVKNKVAPPFKTAEFDIMYGEGISRVGEVLDSAVSLNIVKKSGAWSSYNGERLGQGRDNVKNLLKTNTALCAEIEKQVREQLTAPTSAPVKTESTSKTKEIDPDEPIAYKPVATTKAAARAKIDVAVDDDE